MLNWKRTIVDHTLATLRADQAQPMIIVTQQLTSMNVSSLAQQIVLVYPMIRTGRGA